MKILLWEIRISEEQLAKTQWLLFKLFGVRPRLACGCYGKGLLHGPCYQPFEGKYVDIIKENDNLPYRAVCKCCGATRILSNHPLNPNHPFDDDFFEEENVF